MRFAALLLVSVVLAAVVGCRPSAQAPDLLSVVDFSPRRADVGDQLEVVGTGFPEGKLGTITFRGDLHQPGTDPTRGVSITAPLARTSQNRVSLVLSERLQARFCGAGRDAQHTTFRGDVVIAFAPLKAGAPPVTGTLRDVALDLAPPPLPADVLAERAAEAEQFLKFAGIRVEPRRPEQLLELTVVLPHSRAAKAGLQPKDVIRQVDDVDVHAVEDLVPSGRHRFATLQVARGDLKHTAVHRMDVQGFRSAPPSELALASLIIGVAAAIVLLFMAPAAGLMTWAERLVARRLRASSSGGTLSRRGFWAWLQHGLVSMFSEDLLPAGRGLLLRVVPYLLFLCTSAAFTWLALGLPLISLDLDLGILLAASTTAMVTIGLMLGGWRDAGGWSLVAGIRSALQILTFQVPALTGVVCIVIMSGSARLPDIVSSQGALPWQWHLFRNPTLLVTFLLFLATALPETSRAGTDLPEAESSSGNAGSLRHPASRCLMFFAEWGHVFVLSSFAAALFLGGWRLPGVDPSTQLSALRLQVLGAVLFQAKCWLVVFTVLWVRWVLPRVRVDQVMSVCWRFFIPLALATLVLTVLWVSGLQSPVVRSLQETLSLVMFALSVFAVGYFLRRVLVNLRSNTAQVNVNPWL